jgi:hypothetical protein
MNTLKDHGQSKVSSFIESLVNIAIGFGVAMASQMVIFPYFDIYINVESHLTISCFFTIISIVRSYLLRRLFNKISLTKVLHIHKEG